MDEFIRNFLKPLPNAQTGQVESCQNHMYDKANQELAILSRRIGSKNYFRAADDSPIGRPILRFLSACFFQTPTNKLHVQATMT